MSQNGQDSDVGGQGASKDENERKKQMPDEGFLDHDDNSSSERDIRK